MVADVDRSVMMEGMVEAALRQANTMNRISNIMLGYFKDGSRVISMLPDQLYGTKKIIASVGWSISRR